MEVCVCTLKIRPSARFYLIFIMRIMKLSGPTLGPSDYRADSPTLSWAWCINPQTPNDSAMRDYLVTSLVSLVANFSNCAIILAGDFNMSLLPMVQSAVKAFHLKPTVSFSTRGNNTLDQIFTNFSEFFSAPCSLPPFGLSDHLSVYMGPGIRETPSKSKCKIILSRDKRPSKRTSVGRFFLQVPWSDLLSPDLSCELKLRTLTDIINLGLNTIMPERSTKVYETARPWLSVQLKQLIARRQKTFASGNQYLFKILRKSESRT